MMDAGALKALWDSHAPGLLGRKFDCAVLCPLADFPDGPRLLFEVRAPALRRQPGEVCFPGGRMEGGETAEQCALRETREELHIPTECVQVLGRSDFLCQPGRFLLQPVLGVVDAAGLAAMKPAAAEVAETFTVPLDFFRQTPPQLYIYSMEPRIPVDFPYDAVGVPPSYRWENALAEVPIWHWQGHTIWGITGRIVKNILEIIAPLEAL